MTRKSDDIYWINAGGTLVSRSYPDPKDPPEYVTTLSLSEGGRYIKEAIGELSSQVIQKAQRLRGAMFIDDGHHYGEHWPPRDFGSFIKDSKRFTQTDIDALAYLIDRVDQKKIIINHGTDWMAHNARRLEEALGRLDVKGKQIIFFGAMVPLIMRKREYEQEQDLLRGDALANMECALTAIDERAAAPDAPSRVYIVGRSARAADTISLLRPEEVDKNKDASEAHLELTFGARDLSLSFEETPRKAVQSKWSVMRGNFR